MVDHLNRAVPAEEVRQGYAPTVKSYSDAPKALSFGDERAAAVWLMEQLK
jgi:hypothetical protein